MNWSVEIQSGLRRSATSAVVGILTVLIVFLLCSLSPAAEFTAASRGDYGNVTVMEVSGNFDAKRSDGTVNSEPRQILAREFFRTHRDDYDFLVVFSNFDFAMPEEGAAFYLGVKNDVQGIGLESFDHSPEFGSAGRLQGTIDMGNLAKNVSDPLDPRFEHTLSLINHELLHRWGAYLKFRDASGTVSSALLGREGIHWSYLLDTQGSLHYGSRWRDNGNGTFTAQETRTYYSPLDLYVMGMIGKEQVPPLLLIENPALDPAKLPEIGATISGTARTVTIDEIIAATGERLPRPDQAQKQFKIAFIYATAPGTFSDRDLPALENIRNGFLTRYSILTDGQGLVQVAATPQVELPTNPGVPTSTGGTRTLPPAIDEGVAWLKGRQGDAGEWSDSTSTTTRDTAEALSALHLFGGTATEVARGAQWLAAAGTESSDYLARKVESLARAGMNSSAFSAELVARQNGDGGWGSARNFTSNPVDSALVLKALGESGTTSPEISTKGMAYLSASQNADGGWSGSGTASQVQPTAHVVQALNHYRTLAAHDAAIALGVAFLQQKQNSDGGFGNSPSTVYDSAAAVLALGEVGAASAATSRGVDYLLSQQDANGSWGDSPFQTAMAMQAVYQRTVAPDLLVTSADIGFIPEKIEKLPTNAVIRVEIHNLGRTNIPAATVVLYLGEVRPENIIGSQTASFPGQSSTVMTFFLPVADDSEHLFTVIVDPDNLVAEVGEGNNRAAKILQAQPNYDLDVAEAGLQISANPAEVFQDITLSTTVHNVGTAAVYNVPVRFFVEAGGEQVDIATRNIDLRAGASLDVAVVWRATHAGVDLKAIVQIDPANSYAEADEVNNQAIRLLTVNGSTLPNLSISREQISIAPNPLGHAKPVTIAVVVKNNGFAPLAAVPVNFYSGVPAAGGELLAATIIESIGAGEMVTATGAWERVASAGQQIVTVVVDPDHRIVEVAEDDNEAFVSVLALTLPDLVLTSSAVSITPAVPKEGDVLNLSITVQNAGEQGVDAVLVQVQKAGALACEGTIPTISGNSQATLSIECGTATEAGLYSLAVEVDPGNAVEEQHEDNNSVAKSLPVQNASLWISETYISPNGDGVQDQTLFGFRLDATDAVTVVVRHADGAVVRTYGGSWLENTSGTQVVWEGLSDAGTVVADGIYTIEVVSSGGSALGSARVVVDNNRSSLVDAFIDGELSHRSGNAPAGSAFVGLLSDGSGALYAKQSWAYYSSNSTTCNNDEQSPDGLYLLPRFGLQPELLTPTEWFSNGNICSRIQVGFQPNGEGIAVQQLGYDRVSKKMKFIRLWIKKEKSAVWQLMDEKQFERSPYEIIAKPVWSPDGQAVLYGTIINDNSSFFLLNTENKWSLFIDSNVQDDVKWNVSGNLFAYKKNNQVFVGDKNGLKFSTNHQAYGYSSLEWLQSDKLLIYNNESNPFMGIYSETISIFDFNGISLSSQVPPPPLVFEGTGFLSPDRSKAVLLGINQIYMFEVHNEVMTVQSKSYNELIGEEEVAEFMSVISSRQPVGFTAYSGYWVGDNSNFMYLLQYSPSPPRPGFPPVILNNPYLKYLISINFDENKTTISKTAEVNYSYPQPFFLNNGEYYLLSYYRGMSLVSLIDRKSWTANFEDFTGTSIADEENQSIIAAGYNSLSVIESLQNLRGELLALNRQTDVLLMGTATDLNFADYRLEYASLQNPGIWNLVRPPADTPVNNDIFTTWIPPQRGTYYVRLTVRDKASNVKRAVQQIVWAPASPPSVVNLYLDPELFSPNEDGVRDYTEIHYMTLQPVHLEFTVTDNSGNKVRQMVRDHALAGEYTLLWDGRTDSGLTVADGTYRIKVMDQEFAVEVDKTPPLVKLGLSAISIDQWLKIQWLKIQADLSGYAVDDRLKDWRVEFGTGANPLEWKPLAEGSSLLAGRDEITEALLLNPPQESLLQEFIDEQVGTQGSRRYRLVATDRAGNSTSTVVGPIEDSFIFYQWDAQRTLDVIPGELLRTGSHQVSAIETFDFDLHNLAVQFFINAQWVEAPASIHYDAGKVTAQPKISDETGIVDAVRLKGTDAAGNDYYSNVLRTKEAFSLTTFCDSYSITGKNGLAEELPTLRFEYFDAGKNAWIEYQKMESMIPAGEFSVPVPQFSLPSGKKINIRMTGVGVSGKAYESSAVSWPPNPCPPPSDKVVVEGGGGGSSSSQVSLDVAYPPAECNSISGKAAINAFMNLTGTRPQSIDLFVDEGEGRQKIGQLTPNLSSRFELNTLAMPEGNHPLTAIYNYLDAAGKEQSFSRESRILVDRTLPVAEITYPADASFSCSTLYDQQNTVWYGIPVSAQVGDNLGSARYELYYGEGDNPVNWHVATTFKGGQWKSISGTLQSQGGIGIWNTGAKQGRYSLKLRVVDAAGNVTCHISKVDVNSGINFSKYAPVLPPTSDPTKVRAIPLFSPTAPDISNEIKVEYRLDRPATINAMVFPLQRADDGKLTLAGTPVRTIMTNKPYLAGSDFVAWNGRNDAGNVVADGLYGIAVRATNSCGEEKQRWVAVELDGTAPQTTITFPHVGDKLGTVVEVRGTTTDKYFTDYRLEVGQGQDPVSWTLLATGAASVVEGALGAWNNQQEGPWTLRLSAYDEAKNRNQMMVTVDLGDREDLIKSFSAEPRFISPNQNGIDDYTIIEYVLTAASEVLLEILDMQGQIVKSFTTTTAAAGLFNFAWEGANQQGTFAGDGQYLVRLTTVKADDPFIKQNESLTIGVDTSAPLISLMEPSKTYLNQDHLSIIGSISDPQLAKYTVKLVGPGGISGIDQGFQARSSYLFGTINELPEGAYTLVVEAEDKLGNSSILEQPVILDRTLPKVTLLTSGNERFFGSNRHEIALSVGIVEENPDKFVLRYGPGSDPSTWQVLREGEGLPESDGIFNWEVGASAGLTDGAYTIALLARDKAGLENESRVAVVVDNTPPAAAFALEEGSFISQGSAITGTAFDDNLARWNLEIARGACNASLHEWVNLKSGSAAVAAAPLVTWTKLVEDGDYCLRLTVEDKVEQRTETTIQLRQDTIPPQAPLLGGEIEGKTAIHLQWPANSEPDLVGYHLYRNGQKLNNAPLATLEYSDPNLTEGTFTYTLIAVDLAGNQSAPSSPFTATIDLTAPTARLIAPTPNTYVSGLVAIQGTAYSRTDFKEYRIYIGAGQNPTDWTLLRTSPLPAAAAGDLADWDTLGLLEGIYTIKLEAEDLSGNVTIHTSVVTLDNTPPPAPVLLSASASGAGSANVTINWNPNNEPGLAGYLLFRNDRLVNIGTKILTDFRQHLLTGEIYVDSGVPDGEQSYYLLAMDKAGNLSAASNILEVTLDTHPPQAALVSPKNNATFEGPIVVRAECADSDLATLTYQYRSQQGIWIDFGGGSEPSFTAPFDPQAAELTFGTYLFRVVATDLAGKVDPNPSSISLVYTDQTPPAPPSGFKAVVTGDEVKLTWNANSDIDLAGYSIYRIEGLNKVKLNPVLLTQTEYRDALLPDGQYGYEITAVDKPLGNESAPAAVAARIYAPLLMDLPEVVGSASIKIMGEGVTPLATVAISQSHDGGVTGHYSAVADGNGRFSVAEVSLSPGENRLRAKATDNAGNVSRESEPGVIIYDLPPQAPRSLTATGQEAQVHLTWEAALNPDPDLAGYRIFRTEGEKTWQAVQLALVTGTSYLDENLANAIYRYRVVAVDLSGNESIPSSEATAEIETAPPLAPEITAVTSLAEGGTLALTWAPHDEAAESFRVYRALSGGGPYLQIFTLPAETTTYTDKGLTDGWAYYYVVTTVDALGNESAYSNQRFGIPVDSTAPLAPVIIYPAMADGSVAVESKKISLSGMAEPGSSVEIYRDGLWVGKTAAAKETAVTSEGIDYLGNYAALSPNGKQLALIDGNGTLRVDTLDAGTAISVANNVEGVVWSPGGEKLLYRYTSEPMPPFGLSAQKLAVYEIKTEVNQNLTTDLSANETSPSWSKDGGKIAFISDRSGMPSIWLKEIGSGALSQISGNNLSAARLSPEGEQVAYFQNGSTLIITNNAGETQVIDNETDGVSLAWSPDGERLAFVSHRAGAEDLFYLDLKSGVQVRVTDDPEIESLIDWSPDGTSLVFSTMDSGSNRIWTVANTEKKLVTNLPGDLIGLDWRDSGEIIITDRVRLSFANPAGLFKLDNASLEPGENLFYAIAEDESANRSPASEALSVIVETVQLPDVKITAEDLFIYPPLPQPGEEVTVRLTVANPAEMVINNVPVEVYLWDASGKLSLLKSVLIEKLNPSASETLSFSFAAGSEVGTNSVIAVVDPADRIEELVESNNNVAKDFFVGSSQGKVEIKMRLNGSQFVGNQDLLVENGLINNGELRTVILEVSIEDAEGIAVEAFTPVSVNLPYGTPTTLNYRWNTGSFFAGEYRVHTTARNSTGDLLSEEVGIFQILPDVKVDVAISTSKTVYGASETVRAGILLKNVGVNNILASLVVKTCIFNEQNSEVHRSEKTVSSLWPGMQNSLAEEWNAGLVPPGAYWVQTEVYVGGARIESAAAPFTIAAEAILSGEVILPTSVLLAGNQVIAGFTVRNSGNAGMSGILRATIVDSKTLEVRATAEKNLSLTQGTTQSGEFMFSSQGLLLQSYLVVLKFTGGSVQKTIASASFIIRDGTPPVMTALSPQGGESYDAEVPLTVKVTDDASGVETVEYRIDARNWAVLSPADAATGLYAVTWKPLITDNGEHTIRFRGSDRSGNFTETSPLRFKIQMDSMPPITAYNVGEPRFVSADGEIYVAGNTVFSLSAADDYSGVAKTEYRVDGGAWQAYTAPFSLVGSPDGPLVIDFYSVDNLGNEEVVQSLTITVDTAPPVTDVIFEPSPFATGTGTFLVTTATSVTLSVVDNLSGVQATYYRFDDEPEWQLSSGTLRLADLAYGPHLLRYRSVDHVGNTEEEKRVTLALLGMEVTTELLNRPRVLVWTEDPEHGGKAEPPYTLGAIRALLGEAFGDPEIYTTVITDKEEFRTLLRSGIYNVVMVIRQDIPLDTLFLREMREAINRGTGLLVSHWSNSVPPLLQELFGVDFKGALSLAAAERTLHLYAGPLGDEQTLNVSGRVLKTTLTDGLLAGIIPAESVCEGVRSLTLHAAVSAQSGDQITATLSGLEGKKLVPVDEEQFIVEALPPDTINRITGHGSGDLAFVAVADDGITLSLGAPYGYLEGSYQLALNIAHPDGSSIAIGPVYLSPTCSADLQAGLEVGPFRVVEVDEVRVKTGVDLPAVILGRYGEGRTALLTYDLIASALNGQRSTHLSLLGKAAAYLLPAAARPEAGGLSLLETRVRQHGSGFALRAVDALGAGLTHLPLFDLRQSPLSYTFHLEDGEEAAWRYFVRFADRQGDFAKTTVISLGLESGEIPYADYPASFSVDADAHTRLVQALAWVDEQLPLHPEGVEALGTIRENLIRIDSLPRATSAETDLVIHDIVQSLHQALQLGIDVTGLRRLLDDYLRIVAVEASFIP
jgi:Tol biopolymer transport system component/flagellar hook assembly protein FlgD/fibronectin type 3 domain-containing protein